MPESLVFDGKRIRAYGEVVNGIEAGIIGDGVRGNTGLGVRHGDLGSGHDSPLRVADDTADGSQVGLANEVAAQRPARIRIFDLIFDTLAFGN